jgi:ABC-type phosphate transport system substrate-binding protein
MGQAEGIGRRRRRRWKKEEGEDKDRPVVVGQTNFGVTQKQKQFPGKIILFWFEIFLSPFVDPPPSLCV